jgi:hypothetical protein
MPKGILYVETWPSSPEQLTEYHRWYDEVHLAEVLTIPGIVAARRVDVIRAVRKALAEERFHMSDALQMDPAPVMRLLELRTSGPRP